MSLHFATTSDTRGTVLVFDEDGYVKRKHLATLYQLSNSVQILYHGPALALDITYANTMKEAHEAVVAHFVAAKLEQS